MRMCCGLGSAPAIAPSASRSSVATASSASAKPSSAISRLPIGAGSGVAAEQHRADAAEHARGRREPADGVERRRHVHRALVSTRPCVVRMP